MLSEWNRHYAEQLSVQPRGEAPRFLFSDAEVRQIMQSNAEALFLGSDQNEGRP